MDELLHVVAGSYRCEAFYHTRQPVPSQGPSVCPKSEVMSNSVHKYPNIERELNFT